MDLFLRVLLSVGVLLVNAQNSTPSILNLQARYDAQQDAIFVTWSSPSSDRNDIQYQIQYQIVNREPPENELHYKRVQVTEARLDLPNLQNGDEVELEVKSELDGGARGQPLSISIVKQSPAAQNPPKTVSSEEEDELLPPLNFEATILDPNSVKLEWRPNSVRGEDEVFYVVNIKQLTTNSPGATQENMLRQQIKVDGTEFLLRNLVPGEKYEMTIRTALSAEHTSSTAAIVEITMPNGNDYYEVGNLLIASKFQADGTGTVNLTWEVPADMKEKIEGYNVVYTAANEQNWRSIVFPGDTPTTLLHDLKSDAEYVLRIKTKMKNGVETESGEFRFKTPKVNPNPISKVDVIYSTETNDVRVQWTLQDFVDKAQVAGYDVYISEFKDQPDSQWRYIRVESAETSANINNLPTSTTYFVKIYVRLRDGELLKSSILYKFTTLNEYPRATQLYPRSVEIHGPKTFSYRNLGPHETEIRWRFVPEVAHAAADEVRIYYTTDTDEEDLNSTVWSHKSVELNRDHPEQVSVLSDLQSDSVYFIKAVPKINDQWKVEFAESFSIKTAVEQKKHRRRSLRRLDHHLHKHHAHKIESAHAYMHLKECDSGEEEHQCPRDHHCIRDLGWCIPRHVVKGIIRHTEQRTRGTTIQTPE